MSELKIKKCKSTHGKYNLDNGNVVIEVEVELDTKEITKNVAAEVENLIAAAPGLLEAAKMVLNGLDLIYKFEGKIVGGEVALKKAVARSEGDIK